MHFLWGAATSSHQIEGNNHFNDWWKWELAGKTESKEPSGKATDHWHRFKEDLELAAQLKLNTYRFSIEWSRLQPTEETWDESALDWYENLISECEHLGLLPMVTLHHFTLPQWVADRGGLLWTKLPEAFDRFVARVVKRIGPRVALWCTLNEPVVLVVGGYLGNFMPPGKASPLEVGEASRTLLECHVKAYDRIHRDVTTRTGPWRKVPLAVGIAHNMLDFLPAHRWHPLEFGLAKVFARFYNRAWLDAVTGRKQHFGAHGIVPYPAQVEEARRRSTADFIGINYYTKCYLHWGVTEGGKRENIGSSPNKLFPVEAHFSLPGDKVSQLGWAIHPEGLGKVIRTVQRYRRPIYITENGIADPTDDLRSDYLVKHLSEISKCMEAGADIRGYYHWSLLDNFEWTKGFAPRFGLIEVDYKKFTRKIKPSARLYQELIERHITSGPNSKILDHLGKV